MSPLTAFALIKSGVAIGRHLVKSMMNIGTQLAMANIHHR
jgi:hypothetical protein